MYKYLHIQEAPITDNITDDGHVGAKLPWPVTADKDGTIVVPSSLLGMRLAVGFAKDLAVHEVNVSWAEAFADPQKVIGMYLVSLSTNEVMGASVSAVDSVEMLEHTAPLPVER